MEEQEEATFFWLHPTPNHYESMFLGASPVKLFHFTPFDKKQLQTAPEADGEAQPSSSFSRCILVSGSKTEVRASAS